jgi:hypothetical protein
VWLKRCTVSTVLCLYAAAHRGCASPCALRPPSAQVNGLPHSGKPTRLSRRRNALRSQPGTQQRRSWPTCTAACPAVGPHHRPGTGRPAQAIQAAVSAPWQPLGGPGPVRSVVGHTRPATAAVPRLCPEQRWRSPGPRAAPPCRRVVSAAAAEGAAPLRVAPRPPTAHRNSDPPEKFVRVPLRPARCSQNGSDIRGIALDGVPNEPVTLSPGVVFFIGLAFARWLRSKGHPAPKVAVSGAGGAGGRQRGGEGRARRFGASRTSARPRSPCPPPTCGPVALWPSPRCPAAVPGGARPAAVGPCAGERLRGGAAAGAEEQEGRAAAAAAAGGGGQAGGKATVPAPPQRGRAALPPPCPPQLPLAPIPLQGGAALVHLFGEATTPAMYYAIVLSGSEERAAAGRRRASPSLACRLACSPAVPTACPAPPPPLTALPPRSRPDAPPPLPPPPRRHLQRPRLARLLRHRLLAVRRRQGRHARQRRKRRRGPGRAGRRAAAARGRPGRRALHRLGGGRGAEACGGEGAP